MTPRSIAAAPTSGAPAPSTSTPPAAPIGPPPSAPTTGSSWAPCSTNPRSPPGSCRSPAGSTSASRSCPAGPDGHRGLPDQVRAGRRVVPRAGPHHPGQAPGRLRRWLRLGERRPAAGPARGGSPRIDFLTRLRHDARLYASPAPEQRPKGKRGPRAQVGPAAGAAPPGRPVEGEVAGRDRLRLRPAADRSAGRRSSACGGCWAGRCRSRRLSPQVEGYKKRFTLVTSAVELTGLQMVELFTARFRQEDGFRDLKQRLGWEECRAWTSQPDRADQPGAVGDDEPAAAAAVPAGGGRGGGLVVPAAVEQEQGPAQRAGRGAADAAASRGNSATSLGVGGK